MGTNITGIGNANAIGFKSRVTGGAYFPPELKDALVGVWSAYGKSNDSTDRNIIKNKIKDKGGDFELLNFNYKEGSGYGKYEEDFTQWIYPSEISINSSRFYNNLPVTSGNIWGAHIDYKLTSSFKIKVSNLKSGGITFFYYKNAEDVDLSEALFTSNGEHIVPANNKSDIGVGFIYWEGTNEKVIVEQIPEFKGAVVTDGVDDLIISKKSIPEMLKGNTGFTVISMIAQLNSRATYTNYVRNNSSSAGRNVNYGGERIGKTGIYGFTKQNIYEGGAVVINNILGDKSDYTAQGGTANSSSPLKYYVQAWQAANGSIGEARQIAWYWTFIANRVLTEDEINLVIEKYNLDRPGEIVKPQIYYNVKKQKITNENHSAFDDKLIDYSGNGYDAKLYNFNWDKQSGVGSYPISFKDYTYVSSRATVQVNRDNFIITSNSNTGNFLEVNTKNKTLPIYKVKVEGTNTITNGVLSYRFNNTEGVISRMSIPEDGEYEIPESPSTVNSVYSGWCINGGTNDNIEVKVTVIPEYKDSLIFDGVDDYGKVTGLPILKDYTVVADYKRLSLNGDGVMSAPILSKSKSIGAGAFLFNYRDTGDKQNTYSFGTNTGIANTDDLKGEIYYQSKYINNGATINVGAGEDFDSMWIGTFRDNVSNYFNGVLYFAMLFPYSMSEFLIERQIEKIKGGTLYPNQVEFRPIIPEDENITKVNCFVVDSGVWKVIKPGDYVDVGARIVLNVYIKLPYKVAGASSTAFTGMTVGPSTASNVWDVKGYIKDKTPQKIKLTLAVNEDIVQWNPTISANIPDSYDAVTEWFINGWETKVAVGDWIKKSDRIFFKLKLKDSLHEIGKVTFGGSECQASKASNWSESNNLWEIVTYSSVGDLSQVFNVQVDEYIRYEDIVQPYPALLTFHDGNFNNYTYGDKVKLNSIIKVRAGFNLFPDLYTINSYYLNGEKLSFNALAAKDIVVTNDITLTAEKIYKLEGSAPKCIFSPSKLRMPNSSYSYLGYIPDISGNGNNGVFNNFAFSGMSGANGYTYEYTNTSDFSVPSQYARAINSEKIEFFRYINRVTFYRKNPTYKGKIKIEGLTNAISSGKIQHFQIYTNSKTNTETSVFKTDGVYDIDVTGIGDATNVYFYVLPVNTAEEGTLDKPITIEQVGNYEGSICFDGIDDYIKIDTTGGMTMLMKANVISTTDRILYDQRDKNSEGNLYKEFAVLTSNSDSVLAYAGRNKNGKTYIDGVLNTNITCGQLLNITHNITALPESNLVGTEQGVRIGASAAPASYCKAAVFDFMLFDTKCTDDVIKQLNDIIGIEGDYVQKPSYYWDAYGKSNFDGDKETIPQLGTAESYSFASFDNELDWYLSSNNYIDVVSRNGYKITLKNLSTGIDGWRFQNSTVKRFISNDIPFKIKSDKTVRVYWDMHYNAISSTELRQKVVSVTTINPNEGTLINLRHLTEEELTELNVNKSTMYYLLWFDVSTLAVNEEVTIEMLPAEGGRDLWLNNYGVAYDKMSGYGGYLFKSFNDSADSWNIRGDGTGVEIISRDGYSMTIKKLVQNLDWHISNNEYRYPTVLSKELPFRCKSNKNVGLIWQLKYKTEGATSDTTVTLLNQQLTPNVPLEVNLPYKTQEELTELGAVSTSVYYLLYFSNTTLAIGEEYTVEMLPLYPNGLVLDGVDDYLENLDIPALSDFTVITKRTNLLEEYGNNVSYLVKGIAPTGSRDWALLMEYWYDKLCVNFIYDNSVGNYITPFDSIGFVTPTSYNGLPMTKGISNDTAGLRIARRGASYWNGVFYKLMLYPRTTNMLTINMIKNMMAEDGIIDIHSKLFTDKFTGDFYNLDFNKDFLIGN